MADYSIEEGLRKIGSDLADDIVVRFTPDKAIEAIDALVHVAVSKDLTGKEKADWVLSEALDLGENLIEWFIPRLIELLYRIMMGLIVDFRDGR